MKNSTINKIINLCLWEGANKLFLEFNSEGLSLDYNQDKSQDLNLSNSAANKLEKEIIILNKNRILQSGESLHFIENTSFGYKKITITKLAGESTKYSIKINNLNKTNYRLSELGLNHVILKGLKNHLLEEAPKGLILVVGENSEDRDKSIIALANLFKNKPYSLLNLNKQLPLQEIVSLDINWQSQTNLSSQEISNLIRKHQPDIVINNLDKTNIKEALLELAQENRLIISAINSDSIQEALYSLAQLYPSSYLQKNINLAIYQKFFPRLCPFCKQKQILNKYERSLLKDLEFRYNWKNLEEKSSQSAGCQRCLQTGSPGEIGIFELLSFQDKNLNTTSHINDARKKYELGLIDVNKLLSLN